MTNPFHKNKIAGFKTRLANISLKQYFLFTIAAYFLVGMHYFQQNQGGIGLNLPINPIGWIVISILISLGILQIAKTQKINYTSFLILLSICCFLLLVPLYYAPGTGWYSYTRLLGLFAGLALLFSILQMNFTTDDFHKILRFILIAAFIESIMALIQFYILPYQIVLNISTARPSAIFFQANVAATFFVTGLLVSLYLLQRTSLKEQSTLYNIILHISPITMTLVIVLLQSRTGYISAIICIIAMQLHQHRVNKKWLALVTFGAIIAVASLTLFDRNIRDSSVYSSPGSRSQIYSDSIDLILKKPILGHGYGSFRNAFIDIQAEKYQTNPNITLLPHLTHPHNESLLWLVEGGVVSLIAISIMAFVIANIAFQRKYRAYFKFILLFPILLHTQTELPFYHSVASWLMFLLLLAYLSSPSPTIRLKQQIIVIPRKFAFFALATLIITTTTIQMLSLLHSQKILTAAFRTQNPDKLYTVALPFVSSNFELIINEKKMKAAIEMKLDKGVIDYIEWATRQIDAAPKPRHYRNLIIANLYFDNIAQAKYIEQQAIYLFPKMSWEQSAQLINSKQQPLAGNINN